MRKILFCAAALSIMISQTGCFGSFALVQKVYEFNDDISDNKFVKTLLFYVLNIIPVYGIAGFVDVVIFNLIEFWSGSNPISMEAGEIEEQFATINGESYLIQATKNQFVFHKLENNQRELVGSLVFSEEEQKWSYEKCGESYDLVQFNPENDQVDFYTNNGIITTNENSLDCYALK